MLEHARSKGGNAVICMRFDTSEMGDVWTELCAYGTAVVAVPVDEGAKATAAALGYGQPGGSPATPDQVQAFAQQASLRATRRSRVTPSNRRATRNSRKATRRRYTSQ